MRQRTTIYFSRHDLDEVEEALPPALRARVRSGRVDHLSRNKLLVDAIRRGLVELAREDRGVEQ